MNSPAPLQHFVRQAIDDDLSGDLLKGRTWPGRPGTHDPAASASPDPARIRTRFPPEPNGYLHIGHAKSICLNFGIASQFGGFCHLRFDDTNPEKEEQEYVDAIIEMVRWLGFDWKTPDGQSNLYFASDYFAELYAIAQDLVRRGHAYVDSQSPEAIRIGRGTLTEPGIASPWRDRPVDESLKLFEEMRQGVHPEGSMVLRARISMGSPNINLRDPVLYRIRHMAHHRTGSAWKIYPMYDYAHPLSDALERITHSLCTLEFEDHRPLYDWLIARAAEGGFFTAPLPRQIEFARGNVTRTITSKRKLRQLVEQGHVQGWDDPRMTTLAGLRRRGFTPGSLRMFWERAGVSKSDSWLDYETLEGALREDLEGQANRLTVVTDPLELVIDNWPADQREALHTPLHPQHPERGARTFHFSRTLWIERDDFAEHPPKGFFRMVPGQLVRLRHGYVVRCLGVEHNESGQPLRVHAEYLPDTRSGTPGADSVKVKGNIHWVSADESVPVELRLYGPLFTDLHPDAGGRDFMEFLNPDSIRVVTGQAEPAVRTASPEDRFQFERIGYFVADRHDHSGANPVFNRITGLRDTFVRKGR